MASTVRRVAVLGLGSIGARHVDVLRRIPGIEVIAVPARARDAGLGLTAGSLEEAADMGATACVIATNTGRHCADAAAAVGHGMDVLVEKPLGINADEARQLCETVSAVRRRMFVGYVLRFSASLSAFRRQLPSLGRIHAVRVECQSFLPDWRPDRPFRDSYSSSATEGGVLRDLSHEIDYAGWLFGWPSAVVACVGNGRHLGIAADETADLLWEGHDGCVVSLRLDYLTRPARRRMLATGEHGSLEWDGVADTVTTSLVDATPQVISAPQTRDERLEAQDQAFVDATDPALSTADARLATAVEAVRSLAICDAARQASVTRHTQQVEYQIA